MAVITSSGRTTVKYFVVFALWLFVVGRDTIVPLWKEATKQISNLKNVLMASHALPIFHQLCPRVSSFIKGHTMSLLKKKTYNKLLVTVMHYISTTHLVHWNHFNPSLLQKEIAHLSWDRSLTAELWPQECVCRHSIISNHTKLLLTSLLLSKGTHNVPFW